jgi:hypothetical protein
MLIPWQTFPAFDYQLFPKIDISMEANELLKLESTPDWKLRGQVIGPPDLVHDF